MGDREDHEAIKQAYDVLVAAMEDDNSEELITEAARQAIRILGDRLTKEEL